ncbi:cyclopropane-fatty-acyl-phospholipid synthase family protein [Acidiphilium sp. C61]|jgi:cyclopropane-fatty-acyl-phospholipid synthase|uniref:SAM-dependent methyltransferase n=1 Tax=Acidiphilium sp. C61 TaxID=1671485 RepID=UPI00157B41A5|nr:cyclopropane-fatty-acyl-phospholipid synthase family protein [Acidiphilium sp. C61]
MNLAATMAEMAERLPIPDALTRRGIAGLVGRTDRKLAAMTEDAERAFARDMARLPIALHTDAANAQHYEVPAAFFGHVLGPRRKYSSCFFRSPADTLEMAEIEALEQTCDHAGLADGQAILELGCGWGSLSLFMAERYPAAAITAVSNSASQRAHIEAEAARLGLANLRVVTADMNAFTPERTFDRVVSVEMFEHMSNWQGLLGRVRQWLAPGGALFLHVFSHRTGPYRFDHDDPADWIARHFFTGGIMPSHGLIGQFSDLFALEADWRWNGTHYARTARLWLENYDRNAGPIDEILSRVYGAEAAVWKRRWRLFFLATEGLFGHAGGESWGVSHYRLRPA